MFRKFMASFKHEVDEMLHLHEPEVLHRSERLRRDISPPDVVHPKTDRVLFGSGGEEDPHVEVAYDEHGIIQSEEMKRLATVAFDGKLCSRDIIV